MGPGAADQWATTSSGASAVGPFEDDHPDVSGVSVGELIGEVTEDLSTLLRQELALAKAEVKEEATKAGKGVGMLGAAGYAGHLTVLFLSIWLWWAIGTAIGGYAWSALIVAALWGIVAAVLAARGRKELRTVNPKPERTIDTLKEVPDALKGR